MTAEISTLTQSLERMTARLLTIQQCANWSENLPESTLSLFQELGVALEELQIANEEINQKNEYLAAVNYKLAQERVHHQELFEHSLAAYVLTHPDGVIKQANRTAAQLLNLPQSYLVGQSLTTFLSLNSRRAFRQQLLQAQIQESSSQQVLCLEPRGSEPINVVLTATIVPGFDGTPSICWLVKPVANILGDPESLNQQSQTTITCCKGEVIPLNSNTLWQLKEGLVKLSTTCESGDEILVGLVGPSKPFGGPSAVLPDYRAIVITDQAQLVNLSQSFQENTHLASSMLPQVYQRLQQSLQLLSAMGQRRVEDRVCHFLSLLKQEVGESVEGGTRLKVRLTHQDMANACCTTRVTMTRVLNRLIKLNKMYLDDQRYIVLNNRNWC